MNDNDLIIKKYAISCIHNIALGSKELREVFINYGYL